MSYLVSRLRERRRQKGSESGGGGGGGDANEQVECTHAHLRMQACAHEYIHTWAAPEKEPGQAADKIPGWLCRGRRSAADAAAPAARGRQGGGAVGGRGGDRGQLYQTSAVARMSEWAAWEADSLPPPSFLVHDLAVAGTWGEGTGTAGRLQQERETEV